MENNKMKILNKTRVMTEGGLELVQDEREKI